MFARRQRRVHVLRCVTRQDLFTIVLVRVGVLGQAYDGLFCRLVGVRLLWVTFTTMGGVNKQVFATFGLGFGLTFVWSTRLFALLYARPFLFVACARSCSTRLFGTSSRDAVSIPFSRTIGAPLLCFAAAIPYGSAIGSTSFVWNASCFLVFRASTRIVALRLFLFTGTGTISTSPPEARSVLELCSLTVFYTLWC